MAYSERTEWMFCCPTCATDLVFTADGSGQAMADCPTCGHVWVDPDELLASDEAERRMDADRDDRLMRDD